LICPQRVDRVLNSGNGSSIREVLFLGFERVEKILGIGNDVVLDESTNVGGLIGGHWSGLLSIGSGCVDGLVERLFVLKSRDQTKYGL
jgi:hypothetical protein